MVKNLPANAGDKKDPGLMAESERFPGIGNGNPFQYSCLENSTEGGAWQAMSMGRKESDMTGFISNNYSGHQEAS